MLVGAGLSQPLAALAEAEPQLAQVAVPLPGPSEREAFLHQAAAGFHGSEELSEEDRALSVASLTRLTEGFRIWDLDALRRTSHIEQLGLGEPRRLTIRYLRGRRESSWSYTDPGFFQQRAREVLGGDVLGQDAVIRSRDVSTSRATGSASTARAAGASSSRADVFFVGPTGVGKTELAKALARLLADDESALIRFDMTEYQDETSRARLTGSDPG